MAEYTPTDEDLAFALAYWGNMTHEAAEQAITAHDAEVAAKAWDEGARAAGRYGHEGGWTSDMNQFAGNPYRAHRDQP